MLLSNHSWTDEEHRSLSAMYDRRAAEAERLMAMLEAVSERVGAVYSPALLFASENLRGWLPHTMYYDNGPAGMLFVSTVFEYRPAAERFDAVKRRWDALWKRHAANRVEGADDPAFVIVRHLNNNWWGRRPVRCEAYPNELAESLIERYPAPVDGDRDPALIVDDGQVWQKTTFRQYTDQEARSYKDSAYQVAPDWTVISAGSKEPHAVEFSVSDWIRQPENIKGVDRLWYLCRYEPAQEW